MAIQAAHRETEECLANHQNLKAERGHDESDQQAAFSSRILDLFGDCNIKNKNMVIDKLAMENAQLKYFRQQQQQYQQS